MEKLGFDSDAALARALGVAPPVISKIRHRKLPIGAAILIAMHEISDLSIKDLRALMGDRRERFHVSQVQHLPNSLKFQDRKPANVVTRVE